MRLTSAASLFTFMFGLVNVNGAWAKPSPERQTPFKASASIGGMYVTGNFEQILLNVGGHVSHSQDKMGNDLLFNGYRIWTKLPNNEGYTKVGDDLFVATLPFYYLNKKFFILGTARYDSSQLHQLDHRFLMGAGFGFTAVRSKEFLIRLSTGVHYEHAIYPNDDFIVNTTHTENTRTVPRFTLLSNGWYRKKGKPISFRYVAWLFVNPTDTGDYRININPSINVGVNKFVGINLSVLYNYSSIVLTGVNPMDFRTNFGVTMQFPQKK